MLYEDDSESESNNKTISLKWNMSWDPRLWFNSVDPDLVNIFEIDHIF